jgi:hypothetical protein
VACGSKTHASSGDHETSQDVVELFGRKRTAVGEALNLLGDLPKLGIAKMQPQFLGPALNGIPACQPVRDRDGALAGSMISYAPGFSMTALVCMPAL